MIDFQPSEYNSITTEVDSEWNDETSIVNDKCLKFFNRFLPKKATGPDSIQSSPTPKTAGKAKTSTFVQNV